MSLYLVGRTYAFKDQSILPIWTRFTAFHRLLSGGPVWSDKGDDLGDRNIHSLSVPLSMGGGL